MSVVGRVLSYGGSTPLKISRQPIRAYNGPRLIVHVTPWYTHPMGKMSSGEPMFDDDADVTLQNCHFIPRHLEHNQVPFVYSSPYGTSRALSLSHSSHRDARENRINRRSCIHHPSFSFPFFSPLPLPFDFLPILSLRRIPPSRIPW